jgi:hypothetical protein
MRGYPQHGSGEYDIACRAGELHEQRREVSAAIRR